MLRFRQRQHGFHSKTGLFLQFSLWFFITVVLQPVIMMALFSIKQLLCRFLVLSVISQLGTYAATSCVNETSINGQPFPSLIDVTAEDLISGLERGLFTSVDLVNVKSGSPFVKGLAANER